MSRTILQWQGKTHGLIDKLDASIRELETELALYKGYHDGVEKNGTHVIVPVELLTEIDQWHDFYVADAPEWEGSNTVKVYISIKELRTIRALIKAK